MGSFRETLIDPRLLDLRGVLGFKLLPTKKLPKAKFLVLEMYFI